MKLHEATYRSAVSIAGCSEGPRNGNKVFSRSAEGGKTTQEDPPFFLIVMRRTVVMLNIPVS